MKVNYIYKIAGEVVLTITSEPIQVTIKKGEIKELDLDNDGKNDMSVALLDIVNGMVKLLIKKVIKTVAEPIKTVGEEKEIEREKEEIIIEEEPVFEKEASKERILGLIMPIVIGLISPNILSLEASFSKTGSSSIIISSFSLSISFSSPTVLIGSATVLITFLINNFTIPFTISSKATLISFFPSLSKSNSLISPFFIVTCIGSEVIVKTTSPAILYM